MSTSNVSFHIPFQFELARTGRTLKSRFLAALVLLVFVQWRRMAVRFRTGGTHVHSYKTHITSITIYLQRCQIKLQANTVKLYYYTLEWINFRWRFMFSFSLDRWGHNGHWNVGSLPHSNFTCLFKEPTWRYPLPHCGQRCNHSATKHH